MQVSTLRWSPERGWSTPTAPLPADPQLVLVFYAEGLEAHPELTGLRARFPTALVFGCSTAGEIADTRISDNGIVATVVHFDHSRIQSAIRPLDSVPDSRALGRTLAMSLPHKDLVHTIVLSDGLMVNGSELVRGLREALPPQVTSTGGLSGDGARFVRTTILCGGAPVSGQVAVLGLYGDKLTVGYGSQGGWDPFGPERVVTRSKANVLYELDGQPALDLYKRYLGDHAKDLPSSALLFPLSLKLDDGSEVVRSILGVDEATHSMTFAGDVLEGQQVRLMMANFDRLVDGAVGAARATQPATVTPPAPALALLVSCVGRKIVLSQRAEDELEAVRNTLGRTPELVGFYSYGEISPFSAHARCELHNQTMTITTFSEAA